MKKEDVADEIVDAVCEEVGMCNGAWDMVDPKEIIAAAHNATFASDAVKNLVDASLLIVRLARRLPADDPVRVAALDWLVRKRLMPSVLRLTNMGDTD